MSVLRRTWQTVETVQPLSYLANKLVEGNKYFFRVSAVNQYGTSEPVELSSPVTVESKFGEVLLNGICVVVNYSEIIA